jgi:hypothetical protein
MQALDVRNTYLMGAYDGPIDWLIPGAQHARQILAEPWPSWRKFARLRPTHFDGVVNDDVVEVRMCM